MTNKHGTQCAAEVAGVANNSLCGTGVAFRANIGGVRLLDGEVTDSMEASSLSYRRDHIDIYSSAWGPEDNGKVVEGPYHLAKKALLMGALHGRGGLGSIFMWASGNGGRYKDSCAADGYAGSIYTLSVSSVSENLLRPWYLEPCASTMAATYSSGSSEERQVVTATLKQSCTMAHTGTSASVSLAAGIVALTLEANRNLTWRDVQYITIMAANPEPLDNTPWVNNGVGRKVSLLYGYGLMDAGKMVYLARLWRRTPDQKSCSMIFSFKKRWRTIRRYKWPFYVKGCPTHASGPVRTLEHVQLFLRINITVRGALTVALESPSGTVSVMLPARPSDTRIGVPAFDRWPLMSVQFWGEPAVGQWYLYMGNVDMRRPLLARIETATLVIHGVDTSTPVRLRPPPCRPPSPKWFERQFRKLVVPDNSSTCTTIRGQETDNGPSASGDTNSTTITCHVECANASACSGPGPSQCSACRHLRVAATGACVAACPRATFARASARLCEACHLSCAACRGPGARNCTGCVPDSALLPAQRRCLAIGERCPLGSFLAGGECRACASLLCEVCDSLERCQRCRAVNGTAWVLAPGGQCVRSCPGRHFVSKDRVCRPCHKSCRACIAGHPDSCLACDAGQKLLRLNESDSTGACLRRCPQASFKVKGGCYSCHESCLTCSRGPNVCDECREPLIPSGRRCVDPASIICKKGTLMVRCLTRLVKSSLWMLYRLMYMLTSNRNATGQPLLSARTD